MKPTIDLTCLILVAMFAFLALAGAESVAAGQAASGGRQFRAGAATMNITPPLGISINGYFSDRTARQIHDELHARCLVLDDGRIRLAIVVCDSCMIPRELTDAARQIIATRVGIPADHVLISATHTHTGPTCTAVFQSDPDESYQKFLISRIADAVQRAVNNLSQAKISWGVGSEPSQVFNRRWHMRPGTVLADPFGRTNDLVKMNPPVESPDLVKPAGPTDPEVSILAVQTPEGTPIALLANYSLHYVGTSRSEDISADYYGAFCDRIQELLNANRQDPPFVALLANGTSGDINNINFRQKQPAKRPYEQIQFVAEAIAQEAHRVYRNLRFRDWAPLAAAQKEITLGVRLPNAADITRAEQILAAAKGPELRGYEEVYARETMALRDFPSEVPMIIQALRIGELGIAAIPCEVFVDIGLEIKRKSPFKPSFTIELANGYNGYLPTPEQHRLGGYETWRARSSYLEVEASTKILNTVMALFERLK